MLDIALVIWFCLPVRIVSHSILIAAFKGRFMFSGPIADLDKLSLGSNRLYRSGGAQGPKAPMHLPNAGSLGGGAGYPLGVGTRPPPNSTEQCEVRKKLVLKHASFRR